MYSAMNLPAHCALPSEELLVQLNGADKVVINVRDQERGNTLDFCGQFGDQVVAEDVGCVLESLQSLEDNGASGNKTSNRLERGTLGLQKIEDVVDGVLETGDSLSQKVTLVRGQARRVSDSLRGSLEVGVQLVGRGQDIESCSDVAIESGQLGRKVVQVADNLDAIEENGVEVALGEHMSLGIGSRAGNNGRGCEQRDEDGGQSHGVGCVSR